jgi:hypothetical protein
MIKPIINSARYIVDSSCLNFFKPINTLVEKPEAEQTAQAVKPNLQNNFHIFFRFNK